MVASHPPPFKCILMFSTKGLVLLSRLQHMDIYLTKDGSLASLHFPCSLSPTQNQLPKSLEAFMSLTVLNDTSSVFHHVFLWLQKHTSNSWLFSNIYPKWCSYSIRNLLFKILLWTPVSSISLSSMLGLALRIPVAPLHCTFLLPCHLPQHPDRNLQFQHSLTCFPTLKVSY